MAIEEQKQYSPVQQQDEETSQITLRDILNIFWINKIWFIFSIIICLAIACLYIMKTPKTYSRTATVLVKNQKKGGGLTESAVFQDMGMFNMNNDVNNELYVFKSTKLMQSVVKKLNLTVDYVTRSGLKKVSMYTDSPFLVYFLDADDKSSFSVEAKAADASTVKLHNFYNKEDLLNINDAPAMKVHIGDTVNSPVGRIVIIPTENMAKNLKKSITVYKSNYHQIVEAYQKMVSASIADKQASVINLSIKNTSTKRAEDVLNALIDAYNEDAIADKNRVALNTSKFINDRIIVIDKELGNVDANIASFKSTNKLTDVQTETGGYVQESNAYKKTGLDIENQLSMAKYIQEYLRNPSTANSLIPANVGSDQGLESQISTYNTTMLQRDKLMAGSSSKNPLVINLTAQLGPMRQSIVSSVNNLVRSLQLQVNNVRSKEAATVGKVAAIPEQQKYLISVERQQKIKEELYLYLLNKREENELSLAITESNIKVIDYAKGELSPVAPKTSMIMLVALILGFAIPAGIFWLLDTLDVYVRNKKDVEDATSAPFLGEVPQKENLGARSVVVRSDGRDALSEAFRIIRTNMDFMNAGKNKVQTIMFTSANPGSGKTFVSTNLAVSFAQADKKIIIIDTDIRKATLETMVMAGAKKNISSMGLTNYLSGKENDINRIISRGAFNSKLDTIFAGPIPPNPTELLMTDRLENLINELKKSYDYIFLDNVPVGIVADASIVNKLCDLTIYVIRAHSMDRRQLPEVNKLYKEGTLKGMCIVLNGVEYKKQGYGYGGYGYGYGGYGYGYGGYGNYGYGYGYGAEVGGSSSHHHRSFFEKTVDSLLMRHHHHRG